MSAGVHKPPSPIPVRLDDKPSDQKGTVPGGGPPYVAQPSPVGPANPYVHVQGQPPYPGPVYPGPGYPGPGYPGPGYPGPGYAGPGYPGQQCPPGQWYPPKQPYQDRNEGDDWLTTLAMCCGLYACFSCCCDPCFPVCCIDVCD